MGSIATALNGKIYLGTGYDGTYLKDWWEYNPAGDTWTQKTDFGGSPRRLAVSTAINGKVYVGTGYDPEHRKDWWWQS